MSRIGETVGRCLRVFTLLSFGAICLLMVVSVFNRFVPLGSMGWSDEIIELLLVWTLFIAIAEVWRQGQHFHVNVVPDLLRGTAAGHAISIFILLGCLVFQATFVWQASELMLQANDVSPIFSWSRRWWYLPMPLAGTIMTLVTINDLSALLRRRDRAAGTPSPAFPSEDHRK